MPTRYVVATLALGVLVLAAAVLVAPMITAVNDDAETSLELQDGERHNLTDTLSIAASNVSTSGDNATLSLRNERTLNTTQTTLNQSETTTLSLEGRNITVELRDVADDGTLTVDTKYPPLFGWDSGPQTFVNNMGLIMALVIVAAIIAILVVIRV